MTLPARSRQLRLVCARNEATIGGMDADDFPPIPRVEGGEGFELDPKILREAITQVVFAAATDDSRPVLTGVDTLMEDTELTLAAADGFRLVGAPPAARARPSPSARRSSSRRARWPS